MLSGHDGIAKTRERIAQCYYWSGMDADIQNTCRSATVAKSGELDTTLNHPCCSHHCRSAPSLNNEFTPICLVHSKPKQEKVHSLHD